MMTAKTYKGAMAMNERFSRVALLICLLGALGAFLVGCSGQVAPKDLTKKDLQELEQECYELFGDLDYFLSFSFGGKSPYEVFRLKNDVRGDDLKTYLVFKNLQFTKTAYSWKYSSGKDCIALEFSVDISCKQENWEKTFYNVLILEAPQRKGGVVTAEEFKLLDGCFFDSDSSLRFGMKANYGDDEDYRTEYLYGIG